MWIHAGLDHLFLRQFWSALWRLHVAARICYFLWMVAHAGLAVGVWSSSMEHDPTCQRCLQEPESISHCLWACPASVDVWRAVSLLLSRAGVQHGFLTWGSVSWIHPAPGPHLFFDCSDRDPVYMLTPSGYLRGCMSMLRPLPSDTAIGPRDEVFSTIVCISLWNVWRARCFQVISHSPSTAVDVLTYIWTDLIHTLSSRWSAVAGPSRAATERRHSFLRRWMRTPLFCSLRGGRLGWHYSPPQWFILHTSHQPP